VLLRLTYLSMTNLFALLRLLAVSDQNEDAEILVQRHQITVLERQPGTIRPRFSSADRAFLAALPALARRAEPVPAAGRNAELGRPGWRCGTYPRPIFGY
jgi:hypothetical protein